MTTLKVGDRVALRGTVVQFDPSDDRPYRIQMDGEPADNHFGWLHERAVVRKLTTRKPAPKVDRVMVAAALMTFVSRWNAPRDLESDEDYAKRMRSLSLAHADALIAEGAK